MEWWNGGKPRGSAELQLGGIPVATITKWHKNKRNDGMVEEDNAGMVENRLGAPSSNSAVFCQSSPPSPSWGSAFPGRMHSSATIPFAS